MAINEILFKDRAGKIGARISGIVKIIRRNDNGEVIGESEENINNLVLCGEPFIYTYNPRKFVQAELDSFVRAQRPAAFGYLRSNLPFAINSITTLVSIQAYFLK
jgi:hypothetical protein